MNLVNIPFNADDVRARLAAHRAWFDDSRVGAEFAVTVDPTQPGASRAISDAVLAALRADGGPAFLRGVRLNGIRLVGAPLAGGLLSDAVLVDVDLSEACLDDADMTGADLTRVRLNRASARRAGFGDQWYDCEARDAHFGFGNFVKCEIFRTAMSGSDFGSAAMLGVGFFDCDLRNARFRGADLTRARFQSCDLRGADFTGTNLRDVRFSESLLSGVHGEPTHATSVRAKVYDRVRIGAVADALLAPGGVGAAEVAGTEFLDGLLTGRWR